jgi:hypothetical protein
MAESIAVIDVIVPAAPVVSVTSIGVQGPPGVPGPPGPQGEPGPPGTGEGGGGPHAATHSQGQSDAVDVKNLAGYPGGTTSFLRADQTFAAPSAGAPLAHATTHQPGGSDALAVDAAAATGSLRTVGTGALQACAGNDARLTNTRTPTAHAISHQPGGGDALAVDAAAATGSLRTLGTGATQAAAGTDARFTNARSPTAHAASHTAGNSDPVAVTALAGYPGGSATFLRADGTFAAPPGGSLPADVVVTSSVAVGTNPAQAGALRLANTTALHARNAANTGDLRILETAGDALYLGWGGVTSTHNNNTLGSFSYYASNVVTYTMQAASFYPGTDGGAGLGTAGGRWSQVLVKDNVQVGTNPAQQGALRLPNGPTGSIQARNAANSADLNVLYMDAGNALQFGSAASLVGFSSNCYFNGKSLIGPGLITFGERTGPGAAGANEVHLWCEDNGSGKTRLMVQFATGAAIQLAIQP